MNQRQQEALKGRLKAEKKVLNDIKAAYAIAMRDIEDRIKILKADDSSDSKIYQLNYQKALQKQVGTVIDKLNNNEYDTLDQYFHDSYKEAFVGTMYDLQGQGVPLVIPIDPKKVEKAVKVDSKISQGLYKRLGHDTKALKKTITNEISRGISQNMHYNEIARNIKAASGVPQRNAIRIARTEGHRIQQESTLDALHAAKKKGADIVKQWDSTLDGSTRPTHRELDGKVAELEDKFEFSGGEVEAPGMFGSPKEDCNCRCVVLQIARWELGDSFTKMDNASGEIVSIEANGYDDFKKKYWNFAEKERVRLSVPKMNDFDSITSINELNKKAQEAFSKFDINVDFSGMNLNIAKKQANSLLQFVNEYKTLAVIDKYFKKK